MVRNKISKISVEALKTSDEISTIKLRIYKVLVQLLKNSRNLQHFGQNLIYFNRNLEDSGLKQKDFRPNLKIQVNFRWFWSKSHMFRTESHRCWSVSQRKTISTAPPSPPTSAVIKRNSLPNLQRKQSPIISWLQITM